MGKRHEAIGIKQAIRFEWMQKAANLLLAGLDAKTIRQELHEYLSDRMGSGSRAERSIEARSFAVSILINTWVNPDSVLKNLHTSLLRHIAKGGQDERAAHWAMLGAAYPFWFNVAFQTGRLLALQNAVTMKQITGRMVETYGDRQTVTRNTRFVVRSFAFWETLDEIPSAGCYQRAGPRIITDCELATLMFEAVLHAIPGASGALSSISNSPAFFPFQLPFVTGDYVSQTNSRLDVIRYGSDDELLKLRDRV